MSINIQISSGYVVSEQSADAGYIRLEENLKDGFNHIQEVPLSDPGSYKFRIRRISDSTVDLSTLDEVYTVITRDTIILPNDSILAHTSVFKHTETRIYVCQGRDHYLPPTTGVTLMDGSWRVVSITTNNVTVGVEPYQIMEDMGVRIPEITGITGTYGTRTINIEILALDGSRTEIPLVQNIYVNNSLSEAYYLEADNLNNEPFYKRTNSRYFNLFKTAKINPNGERTSPVNEIPQRVENLYFTETANGQAEAASATQFGSLIPIKPVSRNVIPETGSYSVNTSFITVKVYTDAAKTLLLAQRKDVITKDLSEGQDLFRRYSRSILYTVTGYSNTDAFVSPKIKNQTGTLVPALIARSAIKLESSAKINGQVDGINGIVTTVCLDYDSVADTWTYRQTNNPASLFLHVLLHPANAYRVPIQDMYERIEFNNAIYGLKQWHTYCAQNSFTYNSVLDRTSSVLDVLKDIAAAGRASPIVIDGKWGVVIDKPRTEIVQHFSPHNSWGFEAVRSIPRMPDAFRTVIRDEASGYLEKELIVYNAGYNATNAEIYEEISLPGITNKATAINHLRWHLAQSELRPNKYTINTDIEYIVCNRGDRVKVAHDVPVWGIGSARIKSFSGQTLTLDEDLDLVQGTSYFVRIRKSNGTSVTSYATAPTTGIGSILTLSSTLSGLEEGNLILIGTNDTSIKDLIVLSIEPLDNKNARLTLTDYAAEIYSLNLSTKYPASEESQNNLLPPNLQDTIDVYPQVTNILSDVSVATLVSPGVYKYNIRVSIAPEPAATTNQRQLPAIADSVEVQYVEATEEFSSAKTKKFLLSDSIVLDDINTSTQYKIRLRYASSYDSRVGPWALDTDTSLRYYTHTTSAPVTFTDQIDSISFDLDKTTLLVTINRTNSKSPSFSHYELRVLKDPNSEVLEDFWSYADDINNPHYSNIIKIISPSEFVSINLLSFSTPRLDPDGIMYRISCRTVDTNGQVYGTSTLASYLLLPLS